MKKPVAIFLSLFIGFFIGSTIKLGYEARLFKSFFWNTPPKIMNCYGDDLSRSYITEAISFWESKGEKIGSIDLNPDPDTCSGKYIHGYIVIRKAFSGQLDYYTLAITHRSTLGIDMRSAVIYFNPDNFKMKNLMTHELGHAMGYGHADIVGHIMYPEYDKMGPKFWIP